MALYFIIFYRKKWYTIFVISVLYLLSALWYARLQYSNAFMQTYTHTTQINHELISNSEIIFILTKKDFGVEALLRKRKTSIVKLG